MWYKEVCPAYDFGSTRPTTFVTIIYNSSVTDTNYNTAATRARNTVIFQTTNLNTYYCKYDGCTVNLGFVWCSFLLNWYCLNSYIASALMGAVINIAYLTLGKKATIHS